MPKNDTSQGFRNLASVSVRVILSTSQGHTKHWLIINMMRFDKVPTLHIFCNTGQMKLLDMVIWCG